MQNSNINVIYGGIGNNLCWVYGNIFNFNSSTNRNEFYKHNEQALNRCTYHYLNPSFTSNGYANTVTTKKSLNDWYDETKRNENELCWKLFIIIKMGHSYWKARSSCSEEINSKYNDN